MRRVRIIFKTHLDIGFTDLAVRVVERYFREKEDALAQREGRALLPDGTVQSVLRWYAATRGKDALLPLWAPGEADAEDEPQEEAEEAQEAEEDAEKGGDAGAADVV